MGIPPKANRHEVYCGAMKVQQRRALSIGSVVLGSFLTLTACADLDLISKDEQANRLQAAAAFGALREDVRVVQEEDFPGSNDLAAARNWRQTSQVALELANSQFLKWNVATSKLSFVPEDSPGPTKQMVEDFGAAFNNWSTVQGSFQRAVRKCLRVKKDKQASACLETAQVGSVPERLAADAELGSQLLTIEQSWTSPPAAPATPEESQTQAGQSPAATG